MFLLPDHLGMLAALDEEKRRERLQEAEKERLLALASQARRAGSRTPVSRRLAAWVGKRLVLLGLRLQHYGRGPHRPRARMA
ncbi:MAG: hypothetical protein KatS3mg050_0415 [Litorilinea sp.]|nr:MAG: hypothetical protein KatS3mg050_0415 [Litorilinea sp.]